MTTGSGEGGALGTPSHSSEEEPPSEGQDSNFVVSGGDLANAEDDEEPDEKAKDS
jgi:hypothetical protein